MSLAQAMNLGRLLTHTAQLFPERPGVIEDGGRAWCWREIEERVTAMAAALRALGVVRGDRILVQSRNTVQMFESCWVAFRLGCVWVPTNYRLTPPEVAYLGASSGATAMLAEDVFDGHVDAVRAAAPALRHVVRVGGARAGEHDYEALVARHHGDPLPHEDVAGGRPAVVLLHLGHHRPSQGRRADARADGLRGHQPPGRPDSRHDRARLLDRGRAAVARRRHPCAAQRGARCRPGA